MVKRSRVTTYYLQIVKLTDIMHISTKIEPKVRPAAKGIISVDTDQFLFVAGKRGMLNLPGGDIDEGEDSLQ